MSICGVKTKAIEELVVKALALAKANAIARSTLFGLRVRTTPAQTQHQLDELNLLTEKDWSTGSRLDKIGYCDFRANAG